MVNRSFKRMSPVIRAAIIERENQVAFLGHHLEPKKVVRSPGIPHFLGPWPAIYGDQHGIFSRRIKIWRLDHFCVELGAIVGGNIHEFNRDRKSTRLNSSHY